VKHDHVVFAGDHLPFSLAEPALSPLFGLGLELVTGTGTELTRGLKIIYLGNRNE
jgi:hypothetical protein